MKQYTHILKIGLFLMTLSLIAAVVLAGTHQITSPVIGMQQEQRLMENLRQVLPEADEFHVKDETDSRTIYVGYHDGELSGYAVMVETGGYVDQITALVGVDPEFEVMSPVRILEHSETPGLGSRVNDEQWFREQFVGKGFDDELVLDEDIDGIAGATISSRAVGSAVSTALGDLGDYLGEAISTEVDLSHVPDGVYQGAGRGFRDDIRVEVEVSGGRLQRVDVVEHDETPDIAEPAIEVVPSDMKEYQEIYVDVVSGATATTEGIIGAVEDALVALGGDEPDFELADVPDGVYRGEGTGYDGSITVEVEVQDGQLVHIEVVDHYEIPSYVQDVLEVIPSTMLSEQQVVVDAYSGATETTLGIVEAVKNTLESTLNDEDAVELDELDIPDGVFTGRSEGFGGDIEVEVEFRDGQLKRVVVIEHDETPDMAEPAIDSVIKAMVDEQRLDVDAYGGATVTSEALLRAVRGIIEEEGRENAE